MALTIDGILLGTCTAGEENETTVHRKVTARVLCFLSEQGAQAAAQAERQQLAQNPPGCALSNHHHSMASTTGPSNAFNLDDQGPTVVGQRILP